MAELQQAAAQAILEDPDVATLASFIGVDAANNTMLHTGRLLIDLKDERSGSQAETMQRLRERVAQVPGVTLYLQPTQDLTIDAESGPRSTVCRSKAPTAPSSKIGRRSWCSAYRTRRRCAMR